MPSKRPSQPNTALRQARRLRGWSQEEVAERVGTNGFTVSRWELGQSFPRPYFRQKLVELFAQPPEALGLVPGRTQPPSASQPPQLLTSALVPPPPAQVEDPLLPPPRLPTGLIGREALLEHLKARLLSGKPFIHTALYGLPGVGKTALALALAHDPQVRARFADGILWAGLGQTPHVLETLARWGELLGVSPTNATQHSPMLAWAQALRTAIGDRRFLLVLDDAWHSEELLACQVGGTACALLVTTRRPDLALQVAGEDLLAVPELGEAEGLHLLAALAQEVVAAEPEEARALVQAVGGLPLGLILLGKYLHLQAYSGQPRRIRAALSRLHQGAERLRVAQPQALLEAHPSLPADTPLSLQASIELSVAALPQEAQAMLRALALFPPKPASFSEDAALAVSAGQATTLDALLDAGLVESAGPGRYQLHQTIVDATRLHGPPPEVERRFLAWAVAWIETHRRDRSHLEQELPLLLEALRRAEAEEYPSFLIQGATALAPFLLSRNLYATTETLLRQARAAAQAVGDTAGLIATLLQGGRVAARRGAYAEAIPSYQEGIRLARQTRANAQLSQLLLALGVLLQQQGTMEASQACLEDGLALARQREDVLLLSLFLINLGGGAIRQGHYEQAERYYEEGQRLAQAQQEPGGVCAALEGLTAAAGWRGAYTQAETYAQEGAALARQMGDRARLSNFLTSLGELALEQGRFTQAEAAARESLACAREVGFQEGVCSALSGLGEVLLRRGRLAEAEAVLAEGLTLARGMEHRQSLCELLGLLGKVQLQQGQVAQARAVLEEGLTLAREADFRWHLGMLLVPWGDLQLATRQWERAEQAYTEALELAEALASPKGEAFARYGLARLAAAQGNLAQAVHQGQVSLQRFAALGHYQTAEVEHWLATLSAQREANQGKSEVTARSPLNGARRGQQGKLD